MKTVETAAAAMGIPVEEFRKMLFGSTRQPLSEAELQKVREIREQRRRNRKGSTTSMPIDWSNEDEE